MSHDTKQALRERVLGAGEQGTKCLPIGRNSKGLFAESEVGERLSTQSLDEISAYEPTELIITADAGTPLTEIEEVLQGEGQMMGFEAFNRQAATLGGAMSCGLCGPARPFRGAVRDFVLGVEVINGRGQLLRFGGQVIKNVAGYDVSRLYAGSWGTLGVILSASMRVLPRPEREVTVGIECEIEQAITHMKVLGRKPFPVSGSAYLNGVFYLRLSGFEASVAAALRRVGGTQVTDGQKLWSSLCDAPHTLLEADDTPMFRLSLPPATYHLSVPGKWLIDWGGALRWLKTDVPRSHWQKSVTEVGGRILAWPPRREDWLATGEAGIDQLQSRIREAFDPMGLFS